MNRSISLPLLLPAVLCASLAVTGSNLFAQAKPAQAQGQNEPGSALTSKAFAQQAAVAGLQEVYLAQQALQKAQNQAIKDYAKEIIEDHQKVNDTLMQIAQRKKINLPPANLFNIIAEHFGTDRQYVREKEKPATAPSDPAARSGRESGNIVNAIQQWNIKPASIQAARRLQMAQGAQFDPEFMTHMVRDHAQTIQLFEAAASSLEDEELKRFAQRTLPVLMDHQQKATRLMAKVQTE